MKSSFNKISTHFWILTTIVTMMISLTTIYGATVVERERNEGFKLERRKVHLTETDVVGLDASLSHLGNNSDSLLNPHYQHSTTKTPELHVDEDELPTRKVSTEKAFKVKYQFVRTMPI